MGQNAQSSRSFIKTLCGCTRTLNCYRIIGVPGPKCFNPEFGELVFSLTLCDVADAMDAVYAVDAVDAVEAVDTVDAIDAVQCTYRKRKLDENLGLEQLVLTLPTWSDIV